jgi:hypothetical protein
MGSEAGDPVHWRARDAGVNSDAKTTAGYSANTWHHACGVEYSSNSRAAFLDGGNKGTNAVLSTPAGLDTTSIGVALRAGGPIGYLDGMVAEVAIWSAALTDAEVAILALGYLPLAVRPQSLVAYWRLIRDTDEDIVGGYSLTAVNGPSIGAHCRVIESAPPTLGMLAVADGTGPTVDRRSRLPLLFPA